MHSFKVKLFLAGVFLSVLPMLIYQYITYVQSSKTLKSTYAKELKQKVDLVTLLINKSIFQTISDLKMMSSNATEWIALGNTSPVKNQLYAFEEIHHDIKSTSLIDDSYNIVFSTVIDQHALININSVAKKMKNYSKTSMEDIYI